MAIKENVKAKYTLSDLIRAQKNDKMTSNLSKWIRTGVKENGYLYLSMKKSLRNWRYHKGGARRMIFNKSDACRKEIETLQEYDMIEPSKSTWAWGVVMA